MLEEIDKFDRAIDVRREDEWVVTVIFDGEKTRHPFATEERAPKFGIAETRKQN